MSGLPFVAQIDGAFGQGRMKNVNKVFVRVHQPSGLFAGPDFDNLAGVQTTHRRTVRNPARPGHGCSRGRGRSFVERERIDLYPVGIPPLTVVGVTAEVAIGG